MTRAEAPAHFWSDLLAAIGCRTEARGIAQNGPSVFMPSQEAAATVEVSEMGAGEAADGPRRAVLPTAAVRERRAARSQCAATTRKTFETERSCSVSRKPFGVERSC